MPVYINAYGYDKILFPYYVYEWKNVDCFCTKIMMRMGCNLPLLNPNVLASR